MLNEIRNLNFFLNDQKKPNTAIIGGSKISTKIEIINNLIECFDNIIIGGAMANTFLITNGFEIGKSFAEKKLAHFAREALLKSKRFNCNLLLPIMLKIQIILGTVKFKMFYPVK